MPDRSPSSGTPHLGSRHAGAGRESYGLRSSGAGEPRALQARSPSAGGARLDALRSPAAGAVPRFDRYSLIEDIRPIDLPFVNLIEVWDSALGLAFVGDDVDTWTGQRAGIVLQATSVAQRAQYSGGNAYFLGAPSVDCNTARLRATGLSLGLDPGDLIYMAIVARRTADTGIIYQVADPNNQAAAWIACRTVPVPFHAAGRSVQSTSFDINLASATPAAPHLFEVWFDGTHARAAIDGVEGTPVAATGIREQVTRISIGSDTGAFVFGEFEVRFAVLAGATTPSEIDAMRTIASGMHV